MFTVHLTLTRTSGAALGTGADRVCQHSNPMVDRADEQRQRATLARREPFEQLDGRLEQLHS